MRYRTAMIYGGTGVTGRLVAGLLADTLGLDITIAGRSAASAEKTAGDLGAEHPGHAFSAAAIAADDEAGFAAALADIDLLVVAAPVAEHMGAIGRAALAAGTDLIDILVRGLAFDQLKPLAAAAQESGRCFVTQAGFHPGVPGPMIRKAAALVGNPTAVHVGMAMRAELRDASSASEIIGSVAEPTCLYRDGAWREASYTDLRRFHFAPPFGDKDCYPLNMPEVATVAADLKLDAAGVYAAGFNWFIDYVVFTLMVIAHKLGGERLAMLTAPLFYWGNRWFSPKGQCIEMRADVTGTIDGLPAERSYCLVSSDPYGLTAHCILAAIGQMDDGPLAVPGLMLMGERIDADRLFAELAALGATLWAE